MKGLLTMAVLAATAPDETFEISGTGGVVVRRRRPAAPAPRLNRMGEVLIISRPAPEPAPPSAVRHEKTTRQMRHAAARQAARRGRR